MDKAEFSDLDAEFIDVTPNQPARSLNRGWLYLLGAMLILGIAFFYGIGVYVEALWFGSLGFSNRFWTAYATSWALFAVFAALTLAILRAGFWLLERFFGLDKLAPRKILINNQPVDVNPARILRPAAWIAAIFFSLVSALAIADDWQSWAVFLHQPATETFDPIFNRPLGFYFFSLPIYDELANWLTTLAIVLLVATVVYSILSLPQQLVAVDKKPASGDLTKRIFAAISASLALLALIFAWRTWLSRYGYLWTDHASFSGVTYSEANYLLPGIVAVAVALVVAAVILIFNALAAKSLRLLILAIAVPIAVFVVGAVLIPSYVQSFVVKPNELGRETEFIEHNIAATRRAFNLENVQTREYAADTATAAFNFEQNQPTFANIRLWDWHALQDTLRQIQEIRTYYDFPDVDVDRYLINGEKRQVMIAAREFDNNKLPEQSRNWINERLVYTHGYGVTMNPVNEFTNEGKPRFVLSNMPVEQSADIKLARPEIYFGERTNTDIYVDTKQREFDFPQGENNNYTNYQGEGGFAVGGELRRLAIAWELGDLSKLPFSDDVTAESRVLMHRNITERLNKVAPFLTFDTDPYIVINDDGHLFWMIDAYTTSKRFPYSRHHDLNGASINYLRNSVKATVDAYTGAINFYVFDQNDPVAAAYRQTFPELFKDRAEMPAGLLAHIRYPETLMKTQGDVFGLYHTTSAKMFFGREDVWSVAREAAAANTANKGQQNQAQPLEPYQVLMPLPGENQPPEFAQVLPFTPASRNNMIAWMAGRSDAAGYGQLIAYKFPSSRVIDGPAQIEARIDQDAQLSGQITLWNQQGSKVKRGNLIVMPIGSGLLYVEPIYLQAERSPMPELRLVVLATQEKLVYAPSFETALRQLLGEPASASAKNNEPNQPNQPQTADELIKRAAQNLADYQRLTSEGKLGEAGNKLDELKRNLDALQK